LGNFEGILQSDGYGAYDHVGGAGIIHAACWAHARRKFFRSGQTQTSIRIVAQMDELFAIDQKARKENLNPSDRHLLRLEKAKPLLEQDQDSDPGGSWGCTSQERPSQGM
jgi:transposase